MTKHVPVMLDEVMQALEVKKGERFVDATLGAGGHSLEILSRGGELLAIEADPHMIKVAEERLKPYCPTLVQGNFSNISAIARKNDYFPVKGVLMDLGISSLHYEDLGRGFSFRHANEPLDMRLSTDTQAVTAADLVNKLSLVQLRDVFGLTVNYPEANKAAQNIVRRRIEKQVLTVADFTAIAGESAELFLALRMVVNAEEQNLAQGLVGAYEILEEKGVLAVISFHSGEDRIVKRFMKSKGSNSKPLVPSEKEVNLNPKSRSAKLRILIK